MRVWWCAAFFLFVACGGDSGGTDPGGTAAPCETGTDCLSGSCVIQADGARSCAGPCAADPTAVCSYGSTCLSGWSTTDPSSSGDPLCRCTVEASADSCDGVDNNCDGTVDAAECGKLVTVWKRDLAQFNGPITGLASVKDTDISLFIDNYADGSGFEFIRLHRCGLPDCSSSRVLTNNTLQKQFEVRTMMEVAGTVFWRWERTVLLSHGIEASGPTTAVYDDSNEPITSFTVIGSDVYIYATSGKIIRCPATGCSSPPTVIANALPANTVATDGTALFFSSGSAVQARVLKRCDVPDCASPSVVPTPPGSVFLAIANDTLYFSTPMATPPQLLSCPKTGCDANPHVVVPDLPAQSGSFTFAGDSVFWLSTGTVYTCPLAGCTRARVAVDRIPFTVWGFAVTKSYITAGNENGEVVRMLR